jgi:hypothetical protein
LASITAARSEQSPLASAQTPLPGDASTESVVTSTTKVSATTGVVDSETVKRPKIEAMAKLRIVGRRDGKR